MHATKNPMYICDTKTKLYLNFYHTIPDIQIWKRKLGMAGQSGEPLHCE